MYEDMIYNLTKRMRHDAVRPTNGSVEAEKIIKRVIADLEKLKRIST